MNAKELKDLIEFLIEKDVAEFELERGDMKMRMKRGVAVSTVAVPAVTGTPFAPRPSAPVSATAPAALPSREGVSEEAGLHVVRSPIVGTFYEAPTPGAPPFVKIGDTVQSGQVVCIIEAMKLMNEIESDVGGSIVKRYVENSQPVEYGQPLFAIRPS